MTNDIELRDVYKAFGTAAAVQNVSLQVQRGEFFSLLGPSGCGKTTTLRMIAGFEQPDRGQVLIAGEDMSVVPAFRRPTNLVFQRLALFPHLTVFENVAFGLRVKRTAPAEVARRVGTALELVRLDALGSRRPHQLSGGQQQRVALARALINQPRVLLLDEPLGSLDLKLRLQMQLELKRIQTEVGTTFVYVTHDQSEALTMSDRIAVMDGGQVLQIGPPREIYDRPRTAFVAAFIGDTNLLYGRLTNRNGPLAQVDSGTFAVRGRAEGDLPEAVCISIRHERVRVAATLPDHLANRYRGRVRQVVFNGSAVRFIVDVAGTEIRAEQRYDGRDVGVRIGDDVEVGWEEDAAVLLPAEEGAMPSWQAAV